MEELLIQIETACSRKLYWVALNSALSIPDICAALESEDGLSSGARYKSWVNSWVSNKYEVRGKSRVTGDVCYYYRCSILHQGKATHPKMEYSRIVFIDPDTTGIFAHNAIIGNVLCLDASIFVLDILNSAREWLLQNKDMANYQLNIQNFLKFHPDGFGPINGVPLIG